MLPPEVVAALPKTIDPATVTAYARLHAAIDSPLGESHLLATQRATFAISRRSPFDPFAVVELVQRGLRYEKGTFSRTLFLETVTGAKHTMDVSILDIEAVEAFARSVGGAVNEAPQAPQISPPIAFQPSRPVRHELVDVMTTRAVQNDDRSSVRQAFLGLLRARQNARRSESFPRAERYVAPRAHSHETSSSPRDKPAIAVAEPPKPRKKKKSKQPPVLAPELPTAIHESPPPDGPLFTTMHWIALVVLTPIIIAAFVTLARALR